MLPSVSDPLETTTTTTLGSNQVRMWVYEEVVDGRKLSEIINKVSLVFSK